MELANNNSGNNSSENYIEKIDELTGGFNILLGELKKIYVIANMNPDDTEYQQQFENILSNFRQISSALFTMSNDIEINIKNLNKNLFQLNDSINVEKDNKKNLESKLDSIAGQNNSASEMIDEYKYIYNANYLRNWALLLSTLLCISTISFVYKKQVV